MRVTSVKTSSTVIAKLKFLLRDPSCLTSASGKSRLQQYAPPADTVPSKVWPESGSPSLDIAQFSGRAEHRQCRLADVWQNPARGCSRRPARSCYAYRNRGPIRRKCDPSVERL